MYPLTIGGVMAYITRKKIKGITYYYAEECERSDGKVKRKWQKYLGSIEKIIRAIDKPMLRPMHAEIFELGNSAAYLHISELFKMRSIIESVLPKKNQGLSIGFYLILAAINRGIEAVSKRSMWNWFKGTILLRRFPGANKTSLSSQRFWDNMSMVKQEKIHEVWMAIVNSVLDRVKINLSSASFDGTNFYSFIGSFNTRCSIAKRGKNKQGRRDLRQVNYALFFSRNDQFPLYFDVFEGNRHDAKEFGFVIEKFFSAFKQRKPDKNGMTIVFDKGNNSRDNINQFTEDSGFHFVGSVKLDDHKEFSKILNHDKRFIPLSDPRLEQVKAFRTRKEIYGKNLTVIVTFNNNLYTAQMKSINNEINKCLDKLSVISKKLMDRRAGRILKGKPPTLDSVKNQVSSILSKQHMKKLIETTIEEKDKLPCLTYSLNSDKYSQLSDTYLGKNIIITDNHSWSIEEIILTYRSQYIIEDAFKQMKDRKTGSWWPMFHWTDQKILVHGLYCSITLLIRALMMKKVKENGIQISMNALHEKLRGIKEVINVFQKEKRKSPTQSVVSKMDDVQSQLFNIFKIHEYLAD